VVFVHDPAPALAPHVVGVEHSFTSMHVAERPDPLGTKPVAHPHVYPPVVFVQVFDMLRSRPQRDAVPHSLTSLHVPPLPGAE
jgi:hypothetical protein